ncbi:hypothetical protein EYC80_010477 [Monilinia laxa]|uniref:DUF6594 domain-containing protein n=1 Tax=Monilinia laxa TaxID=61186 RepID=A0A5N6JQS7_MONLA|nr:hypothetical protein EYC80_010477 [Monilinia laxa]
MNTLPPRNIDEDSMEKGEHEVHDVVINTFLDASTLQPIRPDGVTDEQFKRSLPDNKTEHFLQYLRGIKNRNQVKDRIIPIIELYPEGYPQLAAVIDSDEQFMLYRRFGHLQARILLNKQDELRELEFQLNHIDKIQLLTHARTLANFDRPMTGDHLRLKDYFDRKAPLCTDEQEWILQKEDLITLKPSRDNTWLDTVVEKIPQNFPCRLTRYIFCTTEIQQKTDPNTTNIFLSNPDRVNAVASAVLLTTVLGLLIIPAYILWYLSHISTSSSAIGVIVAVLLVFTFVFSAVISLFTRAKRHEVLAAAAAYCAVLVVFVGNVGSISPSDEG